MSFETCSFSNSLLNNLLSNLYFYFQHVKNVAITLHKNDNLQDIFLGQCYNFICIKVSITEIKVYGGETIYVILKTVF